MPGLPAHGRTGYRRALRTAALASLLMALAPSRLSATPEALRALTRRAEVVTLATCTASESRWDEAGAVIVTEMRVHIEARFKGSAPETIVLRTLGGKVGRLGMGASHAAQLAAGERAVLFLRQSTFGRYFVFASGTDSKLAIGPGDTVQGVAGGADLATFGSWIEAAGP